MEKADGNFERLADCVPMVIERRHVRGREVLDLKCDVAYASHDESGFQQHVL